MVQQPDKYYKLNDKQEKIYFIASKEIGTELSMIKYLMFKTGMSSSKCHKFVAKIKEVKNQ